MPHIILEYSENLSELPNFGILFKEIHQALHRIGRIKLENCKSRARRAEQVYIGDGNPDRAFIHLDIEFLQGRSTEAKQAIGRECLALVKRYYQLQLSDDLQITVKIDDIELEFYFKEPAGTLDYR